jgi:hypothetical protein
MSWKHALVENFVIIFVTTASELKKADAAAMQWIDTITVKGGCIWEVWQKKGVRK